MSDDTRDALSLSDDEDNDDLDDESHLPELAGTLCKWTNYIHGWQDRYIVLKDGTLSYYKSENETAFGCRGAVSLCKAVITSHEFDDCRLDVAVNDCMWYLRTPSAEDRQVWVDALELHKQAESGYGSENSLRRHGSMLSLTSAASLSTASTSSFKKGRGLKEKLAEMETFRDILCRQVDTLQSYFDACASAIQQQSVHDITNDDDINDVDDFDSPQKNGHLGGQTQTFTMDVDNDRDNKDIVSILQQHGAHAIDFKGQAFTFKATTAGILATLSHCVEVMQQREEAWRKRLERELEKRKKIEEAYKTCLSDRHKPIILGGPDYEEGPHSMMNEEEFFDAVDATLDILDKEEERQKTKKIPTKSSAVSKVDSSLPHRKIEEVGVVETTSPILTEVNSRVIEHITHADMSANDVSGSWQLIAEEGEMKVYKRELEENGLVVDPVKAVHTVKGITGHELCHYFWDTEIRMEWDGTLESSVVLEWLSKDTVVSYQVHKRVWPATQRDSLFWSAIRHCPSEDDEGPDYWIVANCTTDHKDTPVPNKCVRIKINVAMVCQTVVQPPQSGKEIGRENLTCRIQYSANVNPGGWAPASVVRVISKREVPKFLKNFTAYVIEKTKDKPIMF